MKCFLKPLHLNPPVRGLALAALLGLSFGAQGEVVVVTAASASTPSLSKEQVSNIFMGKVKSFPDGGGAVPLDQDEANPIREEFYSKVVGKSAAQVKSYWSKLVFTGKGLPPKEGRNSSEIKKIIATTPGAVGYIEKSAVDSSVKVLFSAP